MIWLLGGYMWLYVHRPFEVWPILGTLQIERVYMFVMLIVWLFAPGKVLVSNRIHYATAFFSFVVLLSWMLSPYIDDPFCSETVEDYFKVIVFYFVLLTTVRDEAGLRLLVTLFLAATGLYMAHSLLEFCRGRYEFRMGIVRMNGVATSNADPNSFASTLLFAFPLAIALWNSRPSKGLRWLLAAFMLGVVVCIALTGSRSAFLGLLVFGVLTLLVTARRKSQAIALCGLGGVLCLGLAVVALPAELQNRYLTIIDSSYGPQNAAASAESRMTFFLEALQAWEKSPLLGHGPRSFNIVGGHGMGAHNLYGQVVAEMGLLGVAALAVFIACFVLNWLEIRRFYQSYPPPPGDFAFQLSRSIAIVLVLLLLLGWSGHTLYRYNWRWFAAFQAIAVYCIRMRQQSRIAGYRGDGSDSLPYLVRHRPAASRISPKSLPS
jgi:O-antigen ligase